MNVLFFIHSLSSGGAERVTTILANHWAKMGWSVTVVTVTDRDCDFYTLDESCQRIALGLDSNSVNTWQSVKNNLHRILVLRRILKKQKPDIAIAMMATANATLSLAGFGLPVCKIGSERTYPPAMPLGRVWDFVRKWSYSKLSGLVAQTQASADWLLSNTKVPYVNVIPNPLDLPLPLYDPKINPNVIQQELGYKYLLLAVGRLGSEKGFDRLLHAFARVYQDYPEWGLVILGEGKQRPLLQAMTHSLGIEDRVRLPGIVGNLGDWYKASDAYVLTSLFEGFPNTLLEAMAHGVPVISVDCETGPSEIIKHEINGLLIPQDNPEALIDGLKRLMGDASLRALFSEHSLYTRERFAVKSVAGQWEQLFIDLLGSNKRNVV